MIGVIGYGMAALAWAALAVLLLIRAGGHVLGRLLIVTVFIHALWAAVMALSLTDTPPPVVVAQTLEALRPFAWSALLLRIFKGRAETRPILLSTAAAGAIALFQCLAPVLSLGAQLQLSAGLLAAIATLLCVEQVYRNAVEGARWAVKFLCLALFAIFAFEVVIYSDALLFGGFEYGWWAARGYANALVAPLVAVTASRMPDWRFDIRLSRHVIFHSATLLAAGVFLLAVSVIGYGIKFVGGAWGGVAQMVVIFAAAVGLLAAITSGTLRAKLRVLVSKHFFRYRYDYRSEWLKLTDLMAQPEASDSPSGGLASRSLKGLSELVASPAGALWLKGDDGAWVCSARHHLPDQAPIAGDHPLARFIAARNWIVDIPEWREDADRYGGLVLPDSMVNDPNAWIVIPLVLHDQLIGFAQLQRPMAPITLDWEVRDVLKTAGRQLAGYLAVQDTVEKLVQARQFDSFNRMSAFVVHDLKNLVAQLSLLLKNAARHRDNPEFQRDMLETVENVLGRMQGLLMQLRVGTKPIEQAAPILLADALGGAILAKTGHPVVPELQIDPTARRAEVIAHRDRLERVIGHLVQNALEATPKGGTVQVRASVEKGKAVIEVADTGRGMSREFIDTRLFRPFSSTKEHGMGIGAFESREYIREIGGSLNVDSTEGRGTTFTLTLSAQVRPQSETESN